jgi:hypothetical protein
MSAASTNSVIIWAVPRFRRPAMEAAQPNRADREFPPTLRPESSDILASLELAARLEPLRAV